MAAAQRHEAMAQEQAHARMLQYHEREKEELAALENLQVTVHPSLSIPVPVPLARSLAITMP